MIREALATARATLIERANGDVALTERLRGQEPLSPTPGYGVLPEIRREEPTDPPPLGKTIYAMPWVERELARLSAEVTDLTLRLSNDLALEPMADLYLALRKRHEVLGEHISYHAYWQAAVREHQQFFAARNALLPQVERLARLIDTGGPHSKVEPLRAEILARVAPFRPVEGLRIQQLPDGTRRLPVEVWTDIEDDHFLQRIREAVEAAFVHSRAARSEQFVVEVTFHHVSIEALYPEGCAPGTGDMLDYAAHRARFPDHGLVLTTGGESTHAWPGDRIVLGPAPMTENTIAHEFAHLLGFSDAYLRGHEKKLCNPGGAVIVEWNGLSGDMMGHFEGGRVSVEQIRTLIRAYGNR